MANSFCSRTQPDHRRSQIDPEQTFEASRKQPYDQANTADRSDRSHGSAVCSFSRLRTCVNQPGGTSASTIGVTHLLDRPNGEVKLVRLFANRPTGDVAHGYHAT